MSHVALTVERSISFFPKLAKSRIGHKEKDKDKDKDHLSAEMWLNVMTESADRSKSKNVHNSHI